MQAGTAKVAIFSRTDSLASIFVHLLSERRSYLVGRGNGYLSNYGGPLGDFLFHCYSDPMIHEKASGFGVSVIYGLCEMLLFFPFSPSIGTLKIDAQFRGEVQIHGENAKKE